jgi:hypothetical protein
MPKIKGNQFELCDICHRAKPKGELEKIIVVYRKCKSCLIDSVDKNPSTEVINERKAIKKRFIPPPQIVSEVFKPPVEMSQGITKQKEEIVDKEVDKKELSEIMK